MLLPSARGAEPLAEASASAAAKLAAAAAAMAGVGSRDCFMASMAFFSSDARSRSVWGVVCVCVCVCDRARSRL